MIRIPIVRTRSVFVAIRRGDDEQSIRSQHAADFREHRIVLREVLQRLEAGDDIHGCIRQRQRRGGAMQVAEIWRAVFRGCGGDRGVIHIHTHDAVSQLREQRTAVAFAAGDIEHVAFGNEVARECVAVQVLDGGAVHTARLESFVIAHTHASAES